MPNLKKCTALRLAGSRHNYFIISGLFSSNFISSGKMKEDDFLCPPPSNSVTVSLKINSSKNKTLQSIVFLRKRKSIFLQFIFPRELKDAFYFKKNKSPAEKASNNYMICYYLKDSKKSIWVHSVEKEGITKNNIKKEPKSFHKLS